MNSPKSEQSQVSSPTPVGKEQGNPCQEQGDGKDCICLAGNPQGGTKPLSKDISERCGGSPLERQEQAFTSSKEALSPRSPKEASTSTNTSTHTPQVGEAAKTGETCSSLETSKGAGTKSSSTLEKREKVPGQKISSSGRSCRPLYSFTKKDHQAIAKVFDELELIEEEEKQIAQLMLSICLSGMTGADKLAKINNLNRDFCRTICKRLRNNGVIDSKHLYVDWFEEPITFVLDLLVAQGSVVRVYDKSDKCSVKNPDAVTLGRLGGKKGGPARAAKLSAQRRQEIAKKAAEARWKQ
jgi:hypothetical protein